jgi:hypothetical protein
VVAELRASVEARGGKVTMTPRYDGDGHYTHYTVQAFDKDGAAIRSLDITGAASRFPPWGLLDPGMNLDAERARFRVASDIDAPPEGGNFDGGFVASATQAARYARRP